MMNVLNDDPEAQQVSEVSSESSVKGVIRDCKIFSLWYNYGCISWERENDENFSSEGGWYIGQVENYGPSLRQPPHICLPPVTSVYVVLIRR